MRIHHWLCPLIVLLAASTVFCQKTIRAKTDAGREVILNEDGTWKYAPPPTRAKISTRTELIAELPPRQEVFKTPRGAFGLRYNAEKWSRRPTQDSSRVTFKLKESDAYAMVITEELEMPLTTLKMAALANAREVAPDAEIVSEERKKVGGNDVLMLTLDGTVNGVPFRYYGYYFSNKNGTIQLLTFTGKSLFDKYQKDLTELLSGFEIY